jgi:hypothetical protein
MLDDCTRSEVWFQLQKTVRLVRSASDLHCIMTKDAKRASFASSK